MITEVVLVGQAGPATPAKAIDQKTEEVDQGIINRNNTEGILPEDKHKSYHPALNYSSRISIQKYFSHLFLVLTRVGGE